MASRTTTAYTLPNPLLRSLDNPFDAGQTVFIVGYTYGDRFSINFTTGPEVSLQDMSEGDPIAFHMDFRFQHKQIVMNKMNNHKWGKHEKVQKLTLEPNEVFDVRIRAHQNNFEIFLNRKPFCTFDYKLPLSTVSHVLIEGAVDLYKVSWEGRYYPIPYESAISMTDGQTFYCSGFVPPHSDRFNLNFKIDAEYALHFDIRLKEKEIVLNHTDDGGVWRTEMIPECPEFPFGRNMTFDIMIRCVKKGFDVFVNNSPLALYMHHYRPERINKLNISGEVTLHSMHWG